VFSKKDQERKLGFRENNFSKIWGKPFLERKIHKEEEIFNRFSKGNQDFQHLNKSMA